MKQVVTTDSAAAPGGPYSQAVVANGFVFISGCTGHRPGPAKELVTSSFRDQVTQAFENLKALAEAAGASLSDAVKATVYLADMNDFAQMNTLFEQYFGQEGPTRTTVPVSLRGFEFEIDAILAVPTVA
jgi:reactive intermediate/imine deaminase